MRKFVPGRITCHRSNSGSVPVGTSEVRGGSAGLRSGPGLVSRIKNAHGLLEPRKRRTLKKKTIIGLMFLTVAANAFAYPTTIAIGAWKALAKRAGSFHGKRFMGPL